MIREAMAFFETGGVVLVAILCLSFVGWYVLLSRWGLVLKDLRLAKRWKDEVESPLDEQRFGKVREICDDLPCIQSRIALFSLQSHWLDRGFSRHLQACVNSEAASWKVRLGLISVIAAVLPLLGLLGTVTGMIDTFGVLSGSANAPAGQLAGGITQALVTTEAGLLAALPLVLGRAMLGAHIRRALESASVHARHIHRLLTEAA